MQSDFTDGGPLDLHNMDLKKKMMMNHRLQELARMHTLGELDNAPSSLVALCHLSI